MFKSYAYLNESTYTKPVYDQVADEYLITETIVHHFTEEQLKRMQEDALRDKIGLENYDPEPKILEKEKIIQDIDSVLNK